MGHPTSDLESAVGQTLYDLQGNLLGTLAEIRVPGLSPRLVLQLPDGSKRPFQGGEFLTAFGGQLSGGFRLNDQGNITEEFSQSQVSGLFSSPSSGRGPAAPAFSSTREAQVLQQQNTLEQLKIQHRNDLDILNRQLAAAVGEEKRRLKNDLKLLQERHRLELVILGEQQKFQERMSLVEQASSLSARASEFQTELAQGAVDLTGRDPIRAAIALQGGLQSGTTPSQALRQRLISLAGQDLPQVDPNANIPGLQATVGQLQEFLQQPVVRPALGLAGGGTIDMRRNGDRFEMEQPAVAVLVGEGPNGEGIRAGTAEVIVRERDRVRVIPLVGAAQGGAELDFGSPISQALSPLFSRLGFGGVPVAQRTGGSQGPISLSVRGALGQAPQPAQPFSSDLFGQLGISPRLFRAGGRLFVRGPGNELFDLGQGAFGTGRLAQLGLRMQDVVDVGSFDELGEVAGQLGLTGQGGQFGVRPLPQNGLSTVEDFNPLSQISAPIILPLGGLDSDQGLFLPAPERIASVLRDLDPTALELVLQAYELAGIPRASVLSRAEAFTPTGSARFGLASAARIG